MRMKPYLMFAIAMIVLCGTVLAQEAAPKVEVFGGYSYFRTSGNSHINGWSGQIAFNLNKWVGFAADFGDFYQFRTTTRPSAKFNTYLFGPQVYDRVGKITGFAHVLIGGGHAENGLTFFGGGIDHTQTVTTLAAGGGIDANIGESFAIRLFQADYVKTWPINPLTGLKVGRNNFRLAAGVVFKIK